MKLSEQHVFYEEEPEVSETFKESEAMFNRRHKEFDHLEISRQKIPPQQAHFSKRSASGF